jgi:hypothetical protein
VCGAVLAAVITLILLASVSFLLSATVTNSAPVNSSASSLAVVQRHAEDQAAVLSASSAAPTDAFIATSAHLSSTVSRVMLSTLGVLEKETRAAHVLRWVPAIQQLLGPLRAGAVQSRRVRLVLRHQRVRPVSVAPGAVRHRAVPPVRGNGRLLVCPHPPK